MTLNTVIALCKRHVRHADIRFAESYGEPGYDNPKAGILFADWNDSPKWLVNGLERRGFDLQWSDEWIECSETSKAYRTSATHYGWLPYYVIDENGEVWGGDEIENESRAQDWYVNEYLLNDYTRCNLFRGVDLTKHGFSQFNGTFETGLHPGQNDEPKEVFNRLQRELPDSDIVFSMKYVGQFDAHWTAWTRPKQPRD